MATRTKAGHTLTQDEAQMQMRTPSLMLAL
jgi:hypothetical protein